MASIDQANLIESNADWNKFIRAFSNGTKLKNSELWKSNIKANVKIVKQKGWASEQLWDVAKGKTVIMIGASPALSNQIDQLRDLQHDPDFVLIGISSGLRYLIQNGIYPKYVMMADAQENISRWFEGITEDDMKKMTMIANLFCHPKVLEIWKGEIYFLGIYAGDKKLDKLIRKLYSPVNGCGEFFHAISSQYNTGAAFAYLVMQARIIIFVGNELSFKDKDVPYYVDRKDEKDSWLRLPHPDIYGNVVYTNYMLYSLKLALEDYLGKLPGYFFNATEAGIFGVSVRYRNLSWVKQMKLPTAIAQAKHVMLYGKPIYDVSLVREPSLNETINIGLMARS